MNPKNTVFGCLLTAFLVFSSLYLAACGSGESQTDGDNDLIACEYSTECPTGYYCGTDGYCVTGTDGDTDTTVDGDTDVVSGIIFRIVPAQDADFGQVSIGTSPAMDITVYNDGNKVLHLKDANFLEPLTDNPWSLVDYAEAAIQPGSSFTFKLKFSADALGDHSGVLQIRNDSDNNSEAELKLSGTVITPVGDAEISTEHEKIEFEDYEIGTVTIYETVLIGNIGAQNSTVYITGISMKSGTSIPFKLEPSDEITETDPIEIYGSSSYGVPLWFKPNTIGDFSDTVLIDYYLSNDTNSATLELPVSGKSIIGSILLDPLEVDFGTLTKNQEKELDLKIVNHNAEKNITVQSVRINGVDDWSDVFEFTDKPAGTELEPSKSADFKLKFAPSLQGDYSGELAISTDDNGKSYYFPIYAEAVAENQKPIARVSQTSHGAEILTDIVGLPLNTGLALFGDISKDPDGDSGLLKFAWSLQKPSGSMASIDDPSLNNIGVTLDKSGDYFFTLVVTDEKDLASNPKIIKATVEPEVTSIKIEADYSNISGESDVDLSWITLNSVCSEETASSGYCQTAPGDGSIRITSCGSYTQCHTESITHIDAPEGNYEFSVRFDEDCPNDSILIQNCPGGLGTQSAGVTIVLYVNGTHFHTVNTTLGSKGDTFSCTLSQSSGSWTIPQCSSK